MQSTSAPESASETSTSFQAADFPNPLGHIPNWSAKRHLWDISLSLVDEGMRKFRNSLLCEMVVVSQGFVAHLALLDILMHLVSQALSSLRCPVSSSGPPSTRDNLFSEEDQRRGAFEYQETGLFVFSPRVTMH